MGSRDFLGELTKGELASANRHFATLSCGLAYSIPTRGPANTVSTYGASRSSNPPVIQDMDKIENMRLLSTESNILMNIGKSGRQRPTAGKHNQQQATDTSCLKQARRRMDHYLTCLERNHCLACRDEGHYLAGMYKQESLPAIHRPEPLPDT